MPDPTDAEIQAGAEAIARSWRVLSHSSRRHLAKLALAAVLPDHDARVHAQTNVARIVAGHWRDAAIRKEWVAAGHALAMVLAALNGETDPTQLGIPGGHPDADQIRQHAEGDHHGH